MVSKYLTKNYKI